jgi:hypothetical protein
VEAREQRQRDNEPGRDKAGAAGTRAGGLAAGQKDGNAGGRRTDGRTDRREEGGGRAGPGGGGARLLAGPRLLQAALGRPRASGLRRRR